MTNNIAYSYVRFSRPDQIKGKSLERQLAASEAYAEKHNLVLDKSIHLHDLGVSAFTGANVETGALGQFLEAVQAGSVKKGSYLLIESLDRLSRAQVLDALTLFTSILSKGITIVTLSDEREYTYKSVNENWSELIISIAVMSRAHEESKTKSDRIKDAWTRKRKQGLSMKRSKMCPAWAKLNDAGDGYVIREGAKETVKLIYDMYINQNLGFSSIAQELNEKKVPTFGNVKHWNKSYIKKLIVGREVLGEYQPLRVETTSTGKKHTPEGDPIEGYYPKIVTESRWEKANSLMKSKAKSFGTMGGSSGQFFNMFKGIAVCGYCGGPMNLQYSTRPYGKYYYFGCGNSRQKAKDCRHIPFAYDKLESQFLQQFPIISQLDNQDESKQIGIIRTQIADHQSTIKDHQKKLDNLLDLVSEGSAPKSVLSRITDLEAKIDFIKGEIKIAEQQLASELMREESSLTDMNSIEKAIAAVNDPDPEAAKLARTRMNYALRNTIDKIVVFPAGLYFKSDKGNFSPITNYDGNIPKKYRENLMFSIKLKEDRAITVFPEYGRESVTSGTSCKLQEDGTYKFGKELQEVAKMMFDVGEKYHSTMSQTKEEIAKEKNRQRASANYAKKKADKAGAE